MHRNSPGRDQVRLLARVAVIAGIPTAALLGSVYAITRSAGIPFTSLSRDPAATYAFPWYGGSISMLGVVIAAAAGVVALVGAWLLGQDERSMASLLGWFGVGIIWFALDDGLMLHEQVLPAIGVPEVVAMAIYGIWGLVLILRFGRQILRETDFGLLAGAFFLLGFQALLDLHLISLPVSSAALEDPMKISALILLFVYACRTLARALSVTAAGRHASHGVES